MRGKSVCAIQGIFARVAELVDALDLESSGLSMRVQVPPLAPEFARTFPAGPRNVLVFCGRASRRNASVPCPAGRHGTSRHPGAPPGPRGCRQLGGSGVLPAPAFSGVAPSGEIVLPALSGSGRPCPAAVRSLVPDAPLRAARRPFPPFRQRAPAILTGTLPCLSLAAGSRREDGAGRLKSAVLWAMRSDCRGWRVTRHAG